MGAIVPPPLLWGPDDDVLLRNALEAGASLESLAKGAVQFSRRYTVKELQDHWLSLLYDPTISLGASHQMFEVERFGSMNQSKPNKLEGEKKEIVSNTGKRKVESVRKCYYAMRKRICNEPLDIVGIDLPSGPSNSSFGDINELSSADCRIEIPDCNIRHDSFPEFGLQFGGRNVSHDFPIPYEDNNNLTVNGACGEVPELNQAKDLSLSDLFEVEGLENEGHACSEFRSGLGPAPFRNFACASSTLPQMPMWNTSSDISAPDLSVQIGESHQRTEESFIIKEPGNETEVYLTELSNRLFDVNDDLLFMDTEEETFDKSYFENFSSLLLDSPSQSQFLCSEPELAVDGDLLGTNGRLFENENKVQDPQVEASTSFVKGVRCGPEYRNGVICCTLNTEDPEIPSNEDVFLPFRFPSPSNSPGALWRSENSSCLASSSLRDLSNTRKENGGSSLVTNNQKNDSCAPSRVTGLSKASHKGFLKYQNGDQGVKFELPKSNIQHAALRNARNNECHSSRISSANVTANSYVGAVVKSVSVEMDRGKGIACESVGVCEDKHEHDSDVFQSLQRNGLDVKAEIPNIQSPNADLRCPNTIDQQQTDKSQVSDEEEWSEKDVPYFSDVEAMILDMDLRPDEFDSYTNPEVQRYQHEESKRTIIRLEQAVDACTRRSIASQGAFALLYGRCSKYFIKKPEVVLGRATEDNKVDIDLGRERNGGKISRRQAILKMDVDGIFQLTNIGKFSMYVNGKEVASGQSSSLNSGCLIEVRGLTYIFETNRARVKHFTDGFAQSNLPLDHRFSNGS